MRAVKTISSPEAFKLFADETRRKIVFLLRAREMTVSQIAESLSITPQTVYHHIKRLVEGGMVEVTREVRVDHLIESYYRATAEAFEFTVGKSSSGAKALKEQIEGALDALKKIGFKINYNETTISKLVEIDMKMKSCCSDEQIEERLSKLEDIDPLTKMAAQEYARLLSMSAEELDKEDEIRKKYWTLVNSLTKKIDTLET